MAAGLPPPLFTWNYTGTEASPKVSHQGIDAVDALIKGSNFEAGPQIRTRGERLGSRPQQRPLKRWEASELPNHGHTRCV